MILGVLAMTAANGAATLAAFSFARRLSTGSLSLDSVLFLLCRYVLIAAVVLAAGLTRLLAPLPLGLLAMAGIAFWFAAGEHRHLPRTLGCFPGWILGTTTAIIVLRLLVQVVIFHPYSVDPLSYHLPKVAHWIQQRALFPYPGADVRETFPAGFELLETWWCVFIHRDSLIGMAGVEFLALGAAATAALARHAGLSPKASGFAAILYALIPAISLLATACMNDGPVAAAMLATLALAAHRANPLLLLASAAIGLGLKPTFGAVLPAAALLYWLERKSAVSRPSDRAAAILLAALAFSVGGFWYGANAIRTGNPLYPVGSLATVQKGTPSGSTAFALGRRLNDLVGSAVYDDGDHYTVQFILVAGWGAACFACGGVGLIAMLRSNPPLRRMASAFGVALIGALVLAPPGSFYLRFLLFFPALGALSTALLCESIPRLTMIPVVAAASCFVSTLVPGDRRDERRFDQVPPDAVVACFSGTYDDSNGESYLAYGPTFSRTVVFLDGIDTVTALMGRLKERRAGWVFPQARNRDGTLRLLLLDATRQGLLRRESTGLYRVLPQ